MLEQILGDLISQPSDWINNISTPAGLRQVVALIIALIAAWPLHLLLQRGANALEARFVQLPWSERFFAVTRRLLLPVSAWLVSRGLVSLFRVLGWERTFLQWAVPIIGLWLLYRLIDTILRVNLAPAQARLWSRQVLLPTIILVALLHSIGLLDDVLHWDISPRENVQITIGSVIAGLVLIAICFALSRGIQQFLEQVFLPQAGAEPGLRHAISMLVAYSVILLGALIALNTMGIDLTTLTVVAGGLSVGLGFGLREIVSNFVSGIILLFERSVVPGNIIQIGESMGVVQNIGVRSLTVKTKDNVELIVPNSRFMTETVKNFTRSDQLVRVSINVGVTYNADPRTVEKVLLAAAEHPRVLKNPAPSVLFQDFGESSLNFNLLVWTDDASSMVALTSELRYNIWEALKAHDIEIPFPQRDVHIRSNMVQ